MEYLKKSFTVAVSSPTRKSNWNKWNEEIEREKRMKDAEQPHDFLGANMCQVCGLGEKAAVHDFDPDPFGEYYDELSNTQ